LFDDRRRNRADSAHDGRRTPAGSSPL